MVLQRSRDVPLYLQLRTLLQQRIASGEWGPGAMLPAEHVLCAEYGVSRGTLRQALADLEAMGLLRREQGRGTFVARGARAKAEDGLSGRSLSFIVPYVRDSFVPTLLLGVESTARAQGFAVLFHHVENDLDKQAAALRSAWQQGVAGILLFPVDSTHIDPVMESLVAQRFPFVLLDRYLRGLHTDYVISDNFGGGLRATQHLLWLGHRRIGFVSWRDPAVTMEHRRAGYRCALEEAGVPIDPALECEVEGYPTIDLGALAEFLRGARGLTAIFAANDQLALAVRRVASTLGLAIPRDLALVGFDDLDIAAQIDVPLTTVAQSVFEMGRTAAEVVIRKIRGEATAVEQHILPTRLVVRQSCGWEGRGLPARAADSRARVAGGGVAAGVGAIGIGGIIR